MKKRLLVLFLVLALLLPLAALAQSPVSRVVDEAGVFTPAQIQTLEEKINAFRQETGLDFAILINKTRHANSAEAFADAYWESHPYGTGAQQSGVLFLVDFSDPLDSQFHVTTTGKAIPYLDDSRRDNYIRILGNALGQAKNSTGDYSRPASLAIEGFTEYFRAGVPQDEYQYNVTTGEITPYQQPKMITAAEGAICAIIAAVAGMILFGATSSSYSLKGSTYSYDYGANSAKKLTASTDQYLRTERQRVLKPQTNFSNGPRGSGPSMGGGHMTSVHTSSGGGVHGGGGGHF